MIYEKYEGLYFYAIVYLLIGRTAIPVSSIAVQSKISKIKCTVNLTNKQNEWN